MEGQYADARENNDKTTANYTGDYDYGQIRGRGMSWTVGVGAGATKVFIGAHCQVEQIQCKH